MGWVTPDMPHHLVVAIVGVFKNMRIRIGHFVYPANFKIQIASGNKFMLIHVIVGYCRPFTLPAVTSYLGWVARFFYISIQTFSMVLLTSKLEKRRVAPATAAPSSRKYEKRRSMSKGKNSFDFFLDNKNES
jgi:hypothetical protein